MSQRVKFILRVGSGVVLLQSLHLTGFSWEAILFLLGLTLFVASE